MKVESGRGRKPVPCHSETGSQTGRGNPFSCGAEHRVTIPQSRCSRDRSLYTREPLDADCHAPTVLAMTYGRHFCRPFFKIRYVRSRRDTRPRVSADVVPPDKRLPYRGGVGAKITFLRGRNTLHGTGYTVRRTGRSPAADRPSGRSGIRGLPACPQKPAAFQQPRWSSGRHCVQRR